VIGPLLDGVVRREGHRILASLVRIVGDLSIAEDALQDAYTRALDRWPTDGPPANPAAWLQTVAHRRALDRLRRARSTSIDDADASVLATDDLALLAASDETPTDPVAESGVDDDRLRLIFMCCHPSIAPAAQMALALRFLGGLSTREIARAFVEPEATTAQRLVRAKQKIRDAVIPFAVPPRDRLEERTAVVLGVIYLIFNEGYAAAEDESYVRGSLCDEAIRLARLVAALLPDDGEVRGLLALLLLTDARRAARLDAEGGIVPLEEQDRTRWDTAKLTEGRALVRPALEAGVGPFRIQAAIAALHGEAAEAAATDWTQISMLYVALLQMTPSVVIELNAAVALAMAAGPEHGLRWMDRLEAAGTLRGYAWLSAGRADLLRRLGRAEESRDAYHAAIALTRSPAERRYLERRLRELGPGPA
jgi:RNA polymerase sigma-70 factor (ECF subfamily)